MNYHMKERTLLGTLPKQKDDDFIFNEVMTCLMGMGHTDMCFPSRERGPTGPAVVTSALCRSPDERRIVFLRPRKNRQAQHLGHGCQGLPRGQGSLGAGGSPARRSGGCQGLPYWCIRPCCSDILFFNYYYG